MVRQRFTRLIWPSHRPGLLPPTSWFRRLSSFWHLLQSATGGVRFPPRPDLIGVITTGGVKRKSNGYASNIFLNDGLRTRWEVGVDHQDIILNMIQPLLQWPWPIH
jgi:hypothetical protein